MERTAGRDSHSKRTYETSTKLKWGRHAILATNHYSADPAEIAAEIRHKTRHYSVSILFQQ